MSTVKIRAVGKQRRLGILMEMTLSLVLQEAVTLLTHIEGQQSRAGSAPY